MSFWTTEQQWCRHEGDRIRKVKGHEQDPNPDWSLPAISRDADELVAGFRAKTGVADPRDVEPAFDHWAAIVWTRPLSVAARELMLAKIFEHFAAGSPPEVVLLTSPRGDGEETQAYLARLARLNGFREVGVKSVP